MQVKQHLLFCEIKTSCGAIFVPQGSKLFVNTLQRCPFDFNSNNKSCIILDQFYFICKGLSERSVMYYIRVIKNKFNNKFFRDKVCQFNPNLGGIFRESFCGARG